jgi:hypothetical protein
MSKLDGNERWKTKMLLAEHQEQYDNRRRERNANRPSEEELRMVQDYVILPHMLTMVDNGIEELKQSGKFMNRIFLAGALRLRESIERDRRRLKKELDHRNIKVVADEQVDLILYHRIYCRGYQDKFGMVREVMRSRIRVKMTEYMREIELLLRNGKGPGNPSAS